jgi:hypothetical protein
MTAASGVQAMDASHDDWMRHLPSDIREQFALAKVRAGLSQMPDTTPVDADLAAVYLCTSPATLKRMRAEGTGPKYLQPKTNEGTTARNQKISYLMGELKRWLEGQSTNSTMHAAELRGTMFATLQDVGRLEPFWIGKHKGVEVVLGHVLATPLTPSLISDGAAHIEWLDWGAALSLPWTLKEQRAVFEVPFKTLLESALQNAFTGFERGEFLTVMPQEEPKKAILRD